MPNERTQSELTIGTYAQAMQDIGSVAVTDGDEYPVHVELGPLQDFEYDNRGEMLPYDGLRKTVRRSTWAKTGMLVGRTKQDGQRPRPVGFESSLERATAISCLLHPNTIDLKCQPRKVEFDQPIDTVKSNTLDFLLVQNTGAQTYLFVKNEETLGRPKTALICQAIRRSLPEGFGFAVISEATFPPVVRGNNERLFLAKRDPDPEADARLAVVFKDLVNADRFTIEELVYRCTASPRHTEQGRAFNAVLRAIADRKLAAPKREALDFPTVLGWRA